MLWLLKKQPTGIAFDLHSPHVFQKMMVEEKSRGMEGLGRVFTFNSYSCPTLSLYVCISFVTKVEGGEGEVKKKRGREEADLK